MAAAVSALQRQTITTGASITGPVKVARRPIVERPATNELPPSLFFPHLTFLTSYTKLLCVCVLWKYLVGKTHRNNKHGLNKNNTSSTLHLQVHTHVQLCNESQMDQCSGTWARLSGPSVGLNFLQNNVIWSLRRKCSISRWTHQRKVARFLDLDLLHRLISLQEISFWVQIDLNAFLYQQSPLL